MKGVMPIISAPRDGSHILLYRPEIFFVGYFATRAGKWCINAPDLPVMDPPPTHWARLPDEPKLDVWSGRQRIQSTKQWESE